VKKTTFAVRMISLLAVAIPTCILIAAGALPGLGREWIANLPWTVLDLSSSLRLTVLAMGAVTLLGAFVMRDWRLIPAVMASAILGFFAPSSMSTDAHLLRSGTELPLALGVVAEPDWTLSSLTERLETRVELPLGGSLLPAPVKLEMNEIRARALAERVKTIIIEQGDVRLDAVTPPDPPDHSERNLRMAAAVESQQRLEAELVRLNCRRANSASRNGENGTQSECEHSREFIFFELDRVFETIAATTVEIEQADQSYRFALDQYRIDMLVIADGLSVAAYLQSAQAEAIQVSQTRAVAFGAAIAILLAGLVTPGISFALVAIPIATGILSVALPLDNVTGQVTLWAQTLIFLSFFGLARVVHLAALVNWPLIRLLRATERRKALLLTLRRSTPIFVVLALLLWGSAVFDRYIQDQLYQLPPPAGAEISQSDVDCPVGTTLVFRQPNIEGCSAQRLETDLRQSIGWHISNLERELNESLADARIEANATSETLGARLISEFDQHALRRLAPDQLTGTGYETRYWSPAFKYEGCSLNPFSWLGCLRNEFREKPRESYAEWFDPFADSFYEKVNNAVIAAQGNIEDASARLLEVIREADEEMRAAADASIQKTFRLLDLLTVLASFFVVLALVRAVTHVFLRCLCAADGLEERLVRHPASVGRLHDREPITIDQVAISEQSTVKLKPGQTYRLRGALQPTNVAASSGWFPRLLFAPRGVFKKYTVKEGAHSAALSFGGALRVVVIRLKRGQTIACNPGSLLGYIEGTQFRSRFLKRALDLLCGRMRSLTVTGPGEVLLSSEGDIINLPQNDGAGEIQIPANKIIAWTPDVQFLARRDDSLWQLYWNPPEVRPLSGGLAVIDQARNQGAGPRPIGLLAALLTQI
jgi:uncharacterized protein (AIM24 family)